MEDLTNTSNVNNLKTGKLAGNGPNNSLASFLPSSSSSGGSAMKRTISSTNPGEMSDSTADLLADTSNEYLEEDAGDIDLPIMDRSSSRGEDDGNMSCANSRASSSVSGENELIDIDMIERFIQQAQRQVKSGLRWSSNLNNFLPDVTLNQCINLMSDAVNNLADSEERVSTIILQTIDRVICPILRQIFRDDFNPTKEQLALIYNCLFGCVRLCAVKFAKARTVEDVADEYWWLLETIFELSRFYQKLKSVEFHEVSRHLTVDVDASLWDTVCSASNGRYQLYEALLVWFCQLRGFASVSRLIRNISADVTPPERVVLYIRWIHCASAFLQTGTLLPFLKDFLENYVEVVCEMPEKDFHCAKLNCDVYDSPVMMFLNIAYGMLIPRSQDYENDCKMLIDKINGAKLRYLKTLILEAKFNIRMSGMEELHRLVRTEYQKASLIPTDFLELWIADNNLIQALYKDNLHHNAYVERLRLIMTCLLEKEVLTTDVLSIMWAAQKDKHDAIQRNVNLLTARLSGYFSEELVNGLITLLHVSWISGTFHERDVIIDLLHNVGLEFCRKEFEAHTIKVIEFLWEQGHCDYVVQNLPVATKIYNIMYTILDAFRANSGHFDVISNIMRLVLRDIVTVGTNRDSPLKGIIDIVMDLLQKCINLQADDALDLRQAIIEELDLELQKIGPASLAEATVEVIITIMGDYKALDDDSDSPCSASSSGRETACSNTEEFNYFLEKLGSLLEFLRFYISERNSIDLLAPESSSLYALWESVINARREKIRDLGYDFFLNLMCLNGIFEKRTLLLFFNKYIVKQQLIFMTASGFNCIEAVLKKINLLAGNLQIFNISDSDKCSYLIRGEIEGLDFLKRLVEESNQEVSDSAAHFLIDLLCSPSDSQSDFEHGKDVVNKCKTWYNESVLPLLTTETSITSSRKIRRVLQTIILLIDTNEEANPILIRKYPTVKRSLMGRGIYLHVICRPEDAQLIFGQEFTPKPVEIPHRFTAHSNMLLGDLINKVCEKFSSQDASVTPYSLNLVKKGNGSSQRFGVVDFGRTLSELNLNNNDQLIAKPEKSKIGLNGTDDESYMSIADPTRCAERENNLFSKIMSDDVEFMKILVENGARDENVCEFTWRLLLALPRPSSKELCALTEMKLADDREAFQGIIQNMFQCNMSQLCSQLMFLNQICLPSEFSFKTENFDTQMLFLTCGGPQMCLTTLITKLDECQNSVLFSIAVQLIMRLLNFSLMALAQFQKKEIAPLKTTCEFLRIAVDPSLEDPVYYLAREHSSSTMVADVFVSETDLCYQDFTKLTKMTKLILTDISRLEYLSIISDGPENDILSDTSVRGSTLSIYCLHSLCYLMAFNNEAAGSLLHSDDWFKLLAEVICDNRENVCRYGSFVLVKVITLYNKLYPTNNIFNHIMNRLFLSMDSLNSNSFWDMIVGCINENQSVTPLDNLAERLKSTVEWLREAERVSQEHQSSFSDTEALVGRLKLCCSLVSILSSDQKAELGASDHGPRLLERLLYHFLLPSSRAFAQMQQDIQAQAVPRSITTNEFYERQGSHNSTNMPRSLSACTISYRNVAVCGTNESQQAAYDLVVILCKDCEPCAFLLKNMILDMFYKYSTVSNIMWDVQPDYSMRKPGNYVGLKNGGATCYMNSILQQLFMIPSLRASVLRADFTQFDFQSSDNKSGYPVKILSSLQSVFAHLIGYDLDAFTPDDLWNTLKSNGNFNLHEQQDALEFYNSVVDLVDEGMKKVNAEKACETAFGGLFADEKICKDCPHRYTCETAFTSISLDVRSHNNLADSLKEYVKGDVLENDNAYHCELCNKKVRAVKRMSIKKLPQTLTVQLKRFEFDWEKDVPVKYNDYFEFPLEIDMYPYTADYFAKQENEENGAPNDADFTPTDSKYKLRGVVVHSGQATNGHYYSYILSNEDGKWYKFDDTDVTPYEMTMRDIKSKWFGAEAGNDDGSKKRRARNWWNAYILFYEKVPLSQNEDVMEASPISFISGASLTVEEPVTVDTQLSAAPINSIRKSSTGSPIAKLHKHFSNMSLSTSMKLIPSRLEKIVRQQNIRIKHERNQYCHNFFRFMFNLADQTAKSASEESARSMRHIIEMFSKFTVFTFLPSAAELRHLLFLSQRSLWNDVWGNLFNSKACRLWFVTNILFNEEISRLFLIDAVDLEVRNHYTSIVSLLLYKTYIARDTIRDLHTEPSTHLNSILRSFPGPYLFAIELLLAVTVNMIKMNRERRSGNVFNTIQDLVAREFTDARIRADLWKTFVKCNFLSIAIQSIGLYFGTGNDINNPANNYIFLRLCGFMFRAINWNYFLNREQEDNEMIGFEEVCPYSFEEIQLVDAHTFLPLNELGHTLVTRTTGNLGTYFEMLHQRMMYAYCLFDPCTDVLHSLLCIAWNNTLRTKATFDWIIGQTKHASELELSKFLLFFRSVVEMRDGNFKSDQWIDYLLKNVDISQVSRSGFRTNHEFGLLSIGNSGSALQQEALFQMLILVLQTYDDRAIEYIRTSDLTASLKTVCAIFMTRFGGNTQPNSPINGISRQELLDQLLTVCRLLEEEVSDNSDAKGDISIEVDEEPLDLSLGHSRASMTPQSGDKRPFPDDPDDSPIGRRRDPKLFRESADHNIDEPELLNATSRSAEEFARQTVSAGPPPDYEFSFEPTPN